NKLKLALEPKIELPNDEGEVEKALEAKGDLDFTVAVEVLPTFELADLSDVEVTKQVTPVTDEELDAALTRMAEQNRSFA
ncbi:trigger factor, partial [Escherichia coli]|nr:trigger factor [Escherichia coli]